MNIYISVKIKAFPLKAQKMLSQCSLFRAFSPISAIIAFDWYSMFYIVIGIKNSLRGLKSIEKFYY